MEIRKGICPHCGKYLGLNEAYQTSVCHNCKRRFDTAAAAKLADEQFSKNGAANAQRASSKSVQCPHCGAKLAVGTGKELTVCPTCHKAFSVSSDSKPGNAENCASHIVASQSSGVTQNSSSSTATYRLSFYEQHKKAIWIGIVVVVIVSAILIGVYSSPTAGIALKGIDVVEEAIVTNPYYCAIGDYVYPIVVLKKKNNSLSTKRVSFEVNIYADGELLGSDQSSYVTLAAGDESYTHAQSDRGYHIAYYAAHEYTYKITRWWVY